MDQNVIQCPTCSKKYKLPANPPATFECRNCGTVMDLSAFGAATPPPPPPAAGGGSGEFHGVAKGASPHRHRRAGRKGRARPMTHKGHGRHEPVDHGYDDDGERPHYQRKKDNTALIYGSIGLVVLALVVLVIFVTTQKKPEEKPKAKAEVPVYVPPPEVVIPEPEVVVKKTPKVAKGREDEKRPELREGLLENVPIPEGKKKYRASRAELQEYPWPEHVTPEERNKIEEAIETFKWGGADMRDAEEYLAELDMRAEDGTLKPGEQFKAVGRLISEFKRISDEFGGELTEADCLSRLMVVDRVLRRVDGMMQRDFADRDGIRAQSTDRHALLAMKRWNWWYDLEKWRMRREPWDERDDLADPEEMEDEFDDDEELPPR